MGSTASPATGASASTRCHDCDCPFAAHDIETRAHVAVPAYHLPLHKCTKFGPGCPFGKEGECGAGAEKCETANQQTTHLKYQLPTSGAYVAAHSLETACAALRTQTWWALALVCLQFALRARAALVRAAKAVVDFSGAADAAALDSRLSTARIAVSGATSLAAQNDSAALTAVKHAATMRKRRLKLLALETALREANVEGGSGPEADSAWRAMACKAEYKPYRLKAINSAAAAHRTLAALRVAVSRAEQRRRGAGAAERDAKATLAATISKLFVAVEEWWECKAALRDCRDAGDDNDAPRLALFVRRARELVVTLHTEAVAVAATVSNDQLRCPKLTGTAPADLCPEHFSPGRHCLLPLPMQPASAGLAAHKQLLRLHARFLAAACEPRLALGSVETAQRNVRAYADRLRSVLAAPSAAAPLADAGAAAIAAEELHRCDSTATQLNNVLAGLRLLYARRPLDDLQPFRAMEHDARDLAVQAMRLVDGEDTSEVWVARATSAASAHAAAAPCATAPHSDDEEEREVDADAAATDGSDCDDADTDTSSSSEA
jgi:hypothetical protein